MYTEKRPRDVLFGAVEELIQSRSAGGMAGGPYMLSQLTRDAASRAEAEAQGRDVTCSNWSIASRAALNAMLSAGVLFTDGDRPVAPGIAARAANITGIDAQFRDATEAYLLEFLIRKLDVVRVQDHVALAHALFRQFDPNVPMDAMEDRVVMLLARLAGRITLRDDSTYVLRPELLKPENLSPDSAQSDLLPTGVRPAFTPG